MAKMLTPQDVANALQISVYRVHQLIRAGRLPATAYSRFYLIDEADVALVAERKPGRPRKDAEAKATTSEAAAPTQSPSPKEQNEMTARERAAKLTDEERRKQFRLEWAQRGLEPTKKTGKKAVS
jgi:excisionase family DNA binding protein